MELFVLRHGIAEECSPRGGTDAERALTTEGKAKVRKVARAMLALGVELELLVSSPYVRARQTAEIVAAAYRAKDRLHLRAEMEPGGDPRQLIAWINKARPRPSGVLLCGHEPYLSGLIGLLVFGAATGNLTLKKAGLCKLSTAALKAGKCAALEWLLTPKQMAALAEPQAKRGD